MKTRSKKILKPSQRRFKQFAADLDSKRSCGDCTACCDAIGVEEIHKPEFTPCKHLCGTGCAVYKNRPTQCREYMCAWKALWTPSEESWRPDQLGVIFDVHQKGMGGRPAIRCWQLRSATQILDDPLVRQMAYSLAVQFNLPIVARYGHVMNITVHLTSQFEALRAELVDLDTPVLAYLLTPDVISDPQDFFRKRETLPADELEGIVNRFGHKAFAQHMGLKSVDMVRIR